MVKNKTKSKTQRNNEHRSIKDWPESERPRKKLLQLGPEGLSDGELLAVLLRIGATGQSAEDLKQAAEIPNKVKAEIIAILRDTGAPI